MGCGEGGTLLMCSFCTCAWHISCLEDVDEIPRGDWECPQCKEENETEMSVKQQQQHKKVRKRHRKIVDDDSHDTWCYLCDDGGKLLCCSTCSHVAHLSCANLKTTPLGDWECADCAPDLSVAPTRATPGAVIVDPSQSKKPKRAKMPTKKARRVSQPRAQAVGMGDIVSTLSFAEQIALAMAQSTREDNVRKNAIKGRNLRSHETPESPTSPHVVQSARKRVQTTA